MNIVTAGDLLGQIATIQGHIEDSIDAHEGAQRQRLDKANDLLSDAYQLLWDFDDEDRKQ